MWQRNLPQSIHATIVALELIDNIHIVHPSSVAVYASNVGVFSAMLPDLSLQQAIIHGVLHAD